MQIGQRQKTRKGVQVPFLEKLLDENKTKLAQTESQFESTEGNQQERLQVLEKINEAKPA